MREGHVIPANMFVKCFLRYNARKTNVQVEGVRKTIIGICLHK